MPVKCLTEVQKLFIIDSYHWGKQTMTQLAKNYKVSRTTISRVIQEHQEAVAKRNSFNLQGDSLVEQAMKQHPQLPVHTFPAITVNPQDLMGVPNLPKPQRQPTMLERMKSAFERLFAPPPAI